MKVLLNEVIDGQNQSYKLFFSIKESSLKNYCDIEFSSTFSDAKNTEAEQTKWKTTIPSLALSNLRDCIDNFFVGEIIKNESKD